jgi:uncharacterized protein with FMN-binding domain
MRRVLLALSGTVAGLVMLLSFKTHPVPVGTAADAGGPGGSGSGPGSVTGTGQAAPGAGTSGPMGSGAAGSGAAGSGAAGSGAAGSGAAGSGASSKTTAGTGKAAGAGGAAASTVATGQAVSTAYGPMQVQATLTGGRLTRVTVLQETNTGARSQQIDAVAVPELNREALTAQSARIDAVSGASYTSSGYIQSLQSALDQARA